MNSAPTLETSRLILRAHRVEDWADCSALWADPEVVRHITGKPSTPSATWSRLLRYAGHWSLLGFGYWLVSEKGTGRFVGEVGLADFRRDIQPSFDGKPEVGWVLATWAHGRGYATEAVRAATVWGDSNLEARAMVCIITPENVASIRVAQKCGFAPSATVELEGQRVNLYERPAVAR